MEDPTQLDPQRLTDLVQSRLWVPLASIVLLWLVRLLKSDTKLPIDIPSGWPRFAIVFVLGAISGVLEKVAGEVPALHYDKHTWTSAIIGGLVTSATALVLHNGWENFTKGKELPLPKALLVPGESPSPGKPPSIPPAGVFLLLLTMGIALVGDEGCTPQQVAAGELAASKVSCVLANLGEPWQRVVERCAFKEGDVSKYERIFSDGQRVMAAAREDERRRLAAGYCAPDGGAR